MLAQEIRQAVGNLAEAMLASRPLVDVLESPVQVAQISDSNSAARPLAERSAEDCIGLEQLLNRVATLVGAPQFKLQQSLADLTVYEQVVSKRLALGPHRDSALDIPESALPEIDQIVENVIAESFERRCNYSKVVSFDGSLLRAYATGSRNKKAVVLVSACGMPAKLCDRWMNFLGKDYFVITWESRGLFEETANFDALAYDVAAQAEDLFAVMDHFGVQTAHLMGLCGGAVIALMAAAARQERISSLSLWHGDYELGPDCPKTTHQFNLKALMLTAATSRTSAALIHKLFGQTILSGLRADLSHTILYPYANVELLFRYGKLNGCIMDTNISHMLDKVVQPTLVVTSEDDSTAHPAGSRRIAEKLSNAILRVEPHGDHLSLFDAEPAVTQLAACFIDEEVTNAICHPHTS